MPNTVTPTPTLGTLPDVQAAIAVATNKSTNAPTGFTSAYKGERRVLRPWTPDTFRPVAEDDTTFLMQFLTEADILAQGGRLAFGYDTYYNSGTVKAALVAGPFPESVAVGAASVGTGCAWFPADGALPLDQFTLTFRLKSVGASIVDQTKNTGNFLSVYEQTGGNHYFTITRYSGSTTANGTPGSSTVGDNGGNIRATLSMDGTQYSVDLIGITAADMPADTWVTISVVLDRVNSLLPDASSNPQYSKLTIAMWNGSGTQISHFSSANTQIAVPSASAFRPLCSGDYNGGGIVVGTERGLNLLGNFQIGGLHIQRYARNPGKATLGFVPSVVVDAGSVGAAVNTRISGAFAQYAGWYDVGADGTKPGSGITPSNIRNQIFTTAAALGCKLARIDHIFDGGKVLITDGVSTTPRFTYDFTALDNQMDALKAAGFVFHITFGFTPPYLAGGVTGPTQRTVVPTLGGSTTTGAALFAQNCSEAIAHWLAKGYTLNSFALWNEPDGPSFWTGVLADRNLLWSAVQSRLATDWAGNAAVPLLGTADGNGWNLYPKTDIDNAAATTKPLGCALFHDYSFNLGFMRNQVVQMRTYLTGKGGSYASVPIGVTEWATDNAIQSQINAPSLNTLGKTIGDYSRSPRAAAYTLAALEEMLAAGVSFATYTRMGILDVTNYPVTSGEQIYGLFSNTDPPRPMPVSAGFQLFWKLAGSYISAVSNWPTLRAVASKDASGNIVLVYNNYRPWNSAQKMNINFEWNNLPALFYWKRFRFDTDEFSDCRPAVLAQGDQTNLPNGDRLSMYGMGCIVITPHS